MSDVMTKDLKTAVVDLAVAVASALHLGDLVIRLHEWLCNHTATGHTYSVGVLASEEEDTYVIDPTTKCKRCGRAMSDKTYADLVTSYEGMREHALDEEDELW